MLKKIALIFFLAAFVQPSLSYAAAVKLGQKRRGTSIQINQNKTAVAEVSCLDTKDCKYDEECLSVRCEHVCKNAMCPEGTYCIPPEKDKPHTYRCVECVINDHCPAGLICNPDFTCGEPDPCINAVCPPAAPFCSPKPFKNLPYTCVQCMSDDHCPPVAGLTRKCVDGFCLFNVEGNIPPEKTPVNEIRDDEEYDTTDEGF